jgi:hypothetical protein
MTNPPGVAVPVADGAQLRRGVATRGPDNVLATLTAGDYPALAQCSGEEVVIPSGATNAWWVKVTAGDVTGWVSAVEILEGADNAPIPGVAEVPTVNE